MNYPTPVIAELPVYAVPAGRSRLAVFLDGDTTNTEDGNVIDEEFFDNCYDYEQFLSDFEERERLIDQVASLEAALRNATSASAAPQ